MRSVSPEYLNYWSSPIPDKGRMKAVEPTGGIDRGQREDVLVIIEGVTP